MNIDTDDLFKQAKKVRQNSYSPYSGFKVGVALLSETGKTYLGTNIEEAAYICTHAEQSAISNMIINEGRHKIMAVMVVAGEEDDGSVVTPCGHCRQWLREHGTDEMKIFAAGPEGIRKEFTLGNLLPYSFGPENLNRSSVA